MKNSNLLIISTLFLSFLPIHSFDYSKEGKDFAQSFTKHYDFATEGRYTHEYHQALLSKTATSLDHLENHLKDNGFNLKGHQIILGYEGNAIPSYYSDFRASKINDEASSHFKDGWSLKLHNRFGLMSGFLFKDINEMLKKNCSDNDSFIKHINPDSVEIFEDEGEILLEHAFGKALPLLFGYKNYIESDIRSKKVNQLLLDLIKFWELLYENDVKSFDGGSAATQDILFSISYAKHLIASKLPINNFYTGGDITYPIETFCGQTKEATKNAQDFVKVFAPSLNPLNNEKTVYVFCSFVDGVGKSTMLGNIQNWMEFKDDVEKYKRVDNSSSQYANVFKFKDNVFIADLPAQVSHFTYKPDGLVYVPANSEKSSEEIEKVRSFVAHQKEALKANYLALYNELREVIKNEGLFSAKLNDPKKPENAFIKNIVLLKKQESNTWVPFDFEGNKYLFNYFNPSEIRILSSLSVAPSSGLKNIESEQMLFLEGVRFPFSYSFFLDDLVKKLKEQDIKNVVFVNFVSMYPRSSRENIRINYLIQQLALLKNDFDVNESLYKNFVSPAQLYAQLTSLPLCKKMLTYFIDEVMIRTVLFKLLLERSANNLKGISIEELTSTISKEISDLKSSSFESSVWDCTEKKFKLEFQRLKSTFGLTKELINIQLFSFKPLTYFSKELVRIFSEVVQSPHLKALWQDLDQKIYDESDVYLGDSDRAVKLEDGTEVVSRFEFYPECKEHNSLTPFLKHLRSAYYSAICNLLYSEYDGGNLNIHNIKYASIPHVVTTNQNGHVYCIQKSIEAIEDSNASFKAETKFNISSSYEVGWGSFEGRPYALSWETKGTNNGLFAFDCNIDKKKKFIFKKSSIISDLVSEYKNQNGQDRTMPTSKLYLEFLHSDNYADERKKIYEEAKKNGNFPLNDPSKLASRAKEKNSPVSIYFGLPSQMEGARLCVRLLATLEMILKDPNSDICVRKGNNKDFIAAIRLFEEIVIPKYFGILFQEPLFDDYDSIEPIISWEECS